MATIDSDMGVHGNHLCHGESLRGDIGCPTSAPYIDTRGYIGIGNTSPSETLHLTVGPIAVSPSSFPAAIRTQWTDPAGYGEWNAYQGTTFMGGLSIFGDGYGVSAQGLLWRSSLLMTAAQNDVGRILFRTRTGGTYQHRMAIMNDGRVGIGPTDPSASLHVKGSVRIGAETAAALQVCDSGRAGAIRYLAGSFDFCDGTNGWRSLAAVAAAGSAPSDRIVSGSTRIIANQTGYISLTTSGVNTGYFDTAGKLIASGVSITTSSGISSTRGYFNSVSIENVDSTPDGAGAGLLKSRNGNAIVANDRIIGFYGRGHTGTGYSGNVVAIEALAAEDFTPSANGTYIRMGTTALGSTTRVSGRWVLSPDGLMGINLPGPLPTPSATIHIRGSLRLGSETSSTLAVCDTQRAGAIRYLSGSFDFCDGTNGWRSLAAVAAAGAGTSDRIVSGSTSIIVGNGTAIVSGSLKLAGSEAEICGPGTHGTIRQVNGRLFVCRQ